jgi:predicted nuclease with TOPRIM domain
MGSMWCREMHTLMQEYMGDLKELQEEIQENQKLQEENERFGYALQIEAS